MEQELSLWDDTFRLKETITYPNEGKSYFYICKSKDMVVIIDEDICRVDDTKERFPYSLITDKQNYYMSAYNKLYRFLKEDLRQAKQHSLAVDVDNIDFTIRAVSNREESIDSSPLEMSFEMNFQNVYGSSSLNCLTREYPITDEDGNNYFLDYYFTTQNQKIAVEENGVSYHHPQELGAERYRRQLKKQNACTDWNIKLFRFSSEDCRFQNRIEDDIRKYFGNGKLFHANGVYAKRQFRLYDHQVEYLHEIAESRKQGINSFLVVLPTATGKSMIIEKDLEQFQSNHPNCKTLIVAPNTNIVADWNERIEKDFKNNNTDINVKTYAYIVRNYQTFDPEYYDYIVIDEAHHAVAPMMKRMIQYFAPEFLIGITATDQRLDKVKLESVFGNYKTKLTLHEAMEKKIIATARAYRIETNLDLSKVRFNGKDYVNADLERTIRVSSRNDLIVDVINTYFNAEDQQDMQGIIFCVNIAHAKEMERIFNTYGITAKAIASTIKNSDQIMHDFKEKKIRFLCSCNMISEGWDYPDLSILVMARPTISKVLYTQQLGRGLRRTSLKQEVYVIDVVDEYGSMVVPCSLHSLLHNSCYVPFGDVLRKYKPDDYIVINGISEQVQNIMEIDIDTYEDKYEGYLSTEQLARECYVSTGTVNNWLRAGKIAASVSFPFGNKKLYMFSPEGVQKIKIDMGCKDHNDQTIKEDFWEFVKEKDYTLSYKMPFMIAFLGLMDSNGEAKIEDVLDKYIEFYQSRIAQGLTVDRSTCPYNDKTLKDRTFIKKNMLANPFEKYERKRFMYYSKDLGVIALNHALVDQLSKDEINQIIGVFENDLNEYYKNI